MGKMRLLFRGLRGGERERKRERDRETERDREITRDREKQES